MQDYPLVRHRIDGLETTVATREQFTEVRHRIDGLEIINPSAEVTNPSSPSHRWFRNVCHPASTH